MDFRKTYLFVFAFVVLFSGYNSVFAQSKKIEGFLFNRPASSKLHLLDVPISPQERSHKKAIEEKPTGTWILYLENCRQVRLDISAVGKDALSLRGKGVILSGKMNKESESFVVQSMQASPSHNTVQIEGILKDEGPHLGIGGEAPPSTYIQTKDNRKIFIGYGSKWSLFGRKVKGEGVPRQTSPGVETGDSYRLFKLKKLEALEKSLAGDSLKFYGFLLYDKNFSGTGYYVIDPERFFVTEVDVSLVQAEATNLAGGQKVEGVYTITKGDKVVLESIAPVDDSPWNALKSQSNDLSGEILGVLVPSAKTWLAVSDEGIGVPLDLSETEKNRYKKFLGKGVSFEGNLVIPNKFQKSEKNLGITVKVSDMRENHEGYWWWLRNRRSFPGILMNEGKFAEESVTGWALVSHNGRWTAVTPEGSKENLENYTGKLVHITGNRSRVGDTNQKSAHVSFLQSLPESTLFSFIGRIDKVEGKKGKIATEGGRLAFLLSSEVSSDLKEGSFVRLLGEEKVQNGELVILVKVVYLYQ